MKIPLEYSRDPQGMAMSKAFKMRAGEIFLSMPHKAATRVERLFMQVAETDRVENLTAYGRKVMPSHGEISWIHIEFTKPKLEEQHTKINKEDPYYMGNVKVTHKAVPGKLVISIYGRSVHDSRSRIALPTLEDLKSTVLDISGHDLWCSVRGKYVAFYAHGICQVVASCKDY